MPAFRFKTLEAAVPDPGEFLLLDFAKFDRPPAIHVGMLALNAFEVPACVRVIPSLCLCASTLANAESVSACSHAHGSILYFFFFSLFFFQSAMCTCSEFVLHVWED